ncbi:MAG TPA: hypothetical protein VG266_12130 [Candidatus Dormibacteraeota bacterium]|jgi:putative copper export protein|nr:hypothetical protein [Candidatus Dormibacteraeota bacterium]
MLTAVRFIHYVSGIAWVGATLVLSLVVFPAIDRCSGEVRAPVMRALARRIAPWEVIASLAVIVSGGAQAVMQHRLDDGLGHALRTTWGQAIGVGALCAIALVVLGLAALAPLTRRFTELEEAVARDPLRSPLSIRELGRRDAAWWRTRQRLIYATTAEIALALVAIGSMAVARGA